MNISFYGACQEVTGSCALIETKNTKFLVDCGIFQGEKFASEKNAEKFGFDPAEIDFVLLTHAHLDHCGRLPKLASEGFKGKVYSTAPTRDLTEIILTDSARVIFEEADRQQRKPLYQLTDVEKLMANFITLPYQTVTSITPKIKIRLRDAGHILGSAIFEVWVKEGWQEKKLVFSGDLGNPPAPIVQDTEIIEGANLVVIESTYAGRVHEAPTERTALLEKAIKESVGQHGTLLIPAFALERTQEVLYELNNLVENKKIPPVPIFVDSPLAIAATSVYKRYSHLYDQESKRLIESGDDLFNFPGLKYTKTKEESKTINHVPPPKIILAGSGMCVGGRMPYHLQRNLDKPQNHLLIIAYQAEGSLGRQLLEGMKSVNILDEPVKVKAKVSAIGAYSSHADGPKLTAWLKAINRPKPKLVFITHGEKESNDQLAQTCQNQLKLKSIIPEYGKNYHF